MFRKQLNPAVTALVVLIVLAVIQVAFWFGLVYRPLEQAPGGGGGGAFPPPVDIAIGRQDVLVETFAGSGPGFADGPGWQARFSGPNALVLTPEGDLLVADSRNHRIRKVTPTGTTSTVAGGGTPGGPGERADGPAASARFRYPSGIALASDGTLYIADSGNHRICRLAGGVVSTLAGGTVGLQDGQGPAARFSSPGALHLAGDGALWVADTGNRKVRRIDAAGRVTSPAEVPAAVREALGEFAAGASRRPVTASVNGTGAFGATRFEVGSLGAASGAPAQPRVYADTRYGVIMAQSDGAEFQLVAGRRTELGVWPPGSDDGTGNRAAFALPCATVVTPGGVVYVAEYDGDRIRRITLPGWMLNDEPAPTPRIRAGDRGRGASGR